MDQFEELYYEENETFFTYVEEVFLKEKNIKDDISKYTWEYLKWFDNLTVKNKEDILKLFLNKKNL